MVDLHQLGWLLALVGIILMMIDFIIEGEILDRSPGAVARCCLAVVVIGLLTAVGGVFIRG